MSREYFYREREREYREREREEREYRRERSEYQRRELETLERFFLIRREDRKYVYEPLRHEESEIRLLHLTPSTSDSTTLECRLSRVPLPKAPRYIALSYHWGDPTATINIKVNDKEIGVTVSLEAALKRLRAAGSYVVWADALCINQTDKQEKSLQIPRIGAVFRKAYEVAIWLGDDLGIDEPSREYLRAETAPKLEGDTCLSTLPVFNSLLDRPFWRRVWIIQELAVASRITLYCGPYRIPWKAIDASCDCCENGNLINRRGRLADENVGRFTMLRGVRKKVLTRQPIRLLDALHRTRSSLATDPRDKIFALLGLTFDAQHFVPEPSYMGSVSDSFREFATSLIASNEPLDFIYLRSANRKVDAGLPSWVTDWTDLDDPVAHRQFDYIMALETPISEDPDTDRDAVISNSGLELEARGVLFDTVDGLGTALAMDSGDISADEIAITHNLITPYSSEDEISSIVHQTLVSTELLSGVQCKISDGLPGDFHRLWSIETPQQLGELSAVVSSVPSNSICIWLSENRSFIVYGQTIEWWTKRWSLLGTENSSVQDAGHFFNAIRSRMRLLMTERGYLGWTHPQTRKGDKIAILFGCSRPVILRACQGGYRIVGDACLSGQSIDGLRKIVDEKVENVRIL